MHHSFCVDAQAECDRLKPVIVCEGFARQQAGLADVSAQVVHQAVIWLCSGTALTVEIVREAGSFVHCRTR